MGPYASPCDHHDRKTDDLKVQTASVSERFVRDPYAVYDSDSGSSIYHSAIDSNSEPSIDPAAAAPSTRRLDAEPPTVQTNPCDSV